MCHYYIVNAYILKGNVDLMFFVLNACTCAVVHEVTDCDCMNGGNKGHKSRQKIICIIKEG